MHIRRTLLIVLTISIILLKLQFEYYNLSFPLLLLSIISFQLAKRKIPKRNKIILTLLAALNLSCLFTPDKSVYRILNSKEYFWSESDLQISDFKGKPDSLSNITAIVFPKIIGKINKVYNYPPAIVFTSNDSYKSWVKYFLFDDTNSSQNRLEKLLEHEKSHLDITEIYKRKAQDSLNKMIATNTSDKFLTINFFFKKSDSIQNIMDIETNHGLNVKKVKKWNAYALQHLKN